MKVAIIVEKLVWTPLQREVGDDVIELSADFEAMNDPSPFSLFAGGLVDVKTVAAPSLIRVVVARPSIRPDDQHVRSLCQFTVPAMGPLNRCLHQRSMDDVPVGHRGRCVAPEIVGGGLDRPQQAETEVSEVLRIAQQTHRQDMGFAQVPLKFHELIGICLVLAIHAIRQVFVETSDIVQSTGIHEPCLAADKRAGQQEPWRNVGNGSPVEVDAGKKVGQTPLHLVVDELALWMRTMPPDPLPYSAE